MSLNPQIQDQGAKVKLTWTPDLSGQGYRLYIDGVAVSRTFKPEASSSTFNKPDSGPHRYGVQKMDVVDLLEEAVWPAAPPPIGGKLRDKPPAGWENFERVDLMGSGFRDFPDTKDVLVNIGDYRYEEGIALVGGRKVVLMGGRVTAFGLSRAAGVGLAVWGRVPENHYYIEGLRLRPELDGNGKHRRTMNDGFAIRSVKGKVTIQNCLVGPCAVKQGFTPNDAHADVLQIQNEFDGELRVHRLTGYVDYSGIMESAFLVRKQDWLETNLVATGYPESEIARLDVAEKGGHTAFGIYDAGLTKTLPGVTMSEFYWAKNPAQVFRGYSPAELEQRGGKFGKPAAGGDYVKEAGVALPYVSPGYV